LFQKDEDNNRPLYGNHNQFYRQKENEELVLFYEYFHGDNGQGLGASHQTGWTALVAELISEYGSRDRVQQNSKSLNGKQNLLSKTLLTGR
jgi:hypothetical protein